ncbi:reverse transcriptase family protein [Terasakiella sp. SH-1]|uniref:reverse transcriptase family protein n=1 Tax=Terasakiella sp. SH-1 TaxID=2560057 RepID=UPI001431CD52|nr:reverse transcriptase family protein [Terasakiella sp. SH-1]
MRSPHALAKLLYVSREQLEYLANLDDNKRFRIFTTKKGRTVQEPIKPLQRLHKRLKKLLTRIETPQYLQSAKKDRSYVTNAQEHLGVHSTLKTDVKKFYPSVKRSVVYGFFAHGLECSKDIAALLAKLTTVNGHLATGSSVSPILSYFAHRPMFEEIHALVETREAIMTLYVDDISVSGDHVSQNLLSKIRAIISRHGLRSHKSHYFPPKANKTITGVIIADGEMRLPNKRHLKIKKAFDAVNAADMSDEKLDLYKALISRVYEASQIEDKWEPRAVNLVSAQSRLKEELDARNP